MVRSVVRPFQRPVTAVLPHVQNRRYAVPNRKFPLLPQNRPVFVFDGVASTILTAIDDVDGPGAWECVAYAQSVSAGAMFMLSSQNNSNALNSNNAVAVVQRGDETISEGGGIGLEVAVKVTGTWDGTFGSGAPMALFLDDIPAGTGVIGTVATIQTLKIGVRGSGGAGFWDGVLAEVKVWQSTPGTGDPEYYWKINEGTGTNIINYGSVGSPAGDVTLTPGAGFWATWPGLEPIV